MNFTILKIVIGFAQRCYCLAVQSCYGHFFCRLGKTGGIHEKGIGYRCWRITRYTLHFEGRNRS
jgi:hypothetical protein